MKNKGKRKIIIIIFILLIIGIAINIFTTIKGYGNVITLIKGLSSKESNSKNNYSNKEISLLENSINISDGVDIEIKKVVISDKQSSLNLTVKETESNILPLKYALKSEGLAETEIKNVESNKDNLSYEEKLFVDYKFSSDELISLYVNDKDGNFLKEIEINLDLKKVISIGDDEVKNISQSELSKYLNIFSEINNGSLINDSLICMANKIKTKISTDEGELDVERIDRNTINEIVKEIYGEKAEFTTGEDISGNNVEVLKLDGPYSQGWEYNKDEDYYQEIADFSEYKNGICLEIKNIAYKDGLFVVDYIYTLATGYDIDDQKIDDLEQYEAIIELNRNDDAKYSKFEIVSLSEGKIVKEKVNSNVEENYNDLELVHENIIPKNTSTDSRPENDLSNNVDNGYENTIKIALESYYRNKLGYEISDIILKDVKVFPYDEIKDQELFQNRDLNSNDIVFQIDYDFKIKNGYNQSDIMSTNGQIDGQWVRDRFNCGIAKYLGANDYEIIELGTSF